MKNDNSKKLPLIIWIKVLEGWKLHEKIFLRDVNGFNLNFVTCLHLNDVNSNWDYIVSLFF